MSGCAVSTSASAVVPDRPSPATKRRAWSGTVGEPTRLRSGWSGELGALPSLLREQERHEEADGVAADADPDDPLRGVDPAVGGQPLEEERADDGHAEGAGELLRCVEDAGAG